jgi:putative ABC transport system permease protein
MKKFKPVEILNNRESSLGIKKRKNNRITEKLQFSPLGMALRMLQRDKKNTCYIILTCFLTIYMVFFSLVSLSNIDKMKENNYYWIGFDQYDVSLSAVNVAEFEEQCQEFIKNDAVTRLIRNNMEVRISIKWQKGSSNAIVYETYENINMPVVKGRNPKYSNEIVLSNIIARELKKKIGDYVDIYLQDKKISLLVVGTYQSFYNMGRGVRMLGSTFEENNIPYVYNEASVYLKRQVDKDKFVEEYQRKYADSLKITDRVKKYGTIFDNICNPQKMALGPFMTFVIMIGCINLLYIIFLKNLSNKKSYSIYKSIGYTVGDLIKMNLWYVGIIATASLLIALPIFITLYPVVMTLSMSMFGFEDYMISIQPTVIAMGSIGMLLTFLVSVILSSRNLYTSIVSELAEE